jgi:plastocyanin
VRQDGDVRKLLTTLAAVALLLAACGKDEGSGSTSGSGSGTGTGAGGKTDTTVAAPVKLQGKVNAKGSKDVTSSGATAELEVEADDFYFGPTYVKTAPGAQLTVKLHNEGEQTHTFTIAGLNVDERLAPGDERTVEVALPASGGGVRFYCTIHGGQGMQGAFYVNPGETIAAAATTSAGTGDY